MKYVRVLASCQAAKASSKTVSSPPQTYSGPTIEIIIKASNVSMYNRLRR